MNIRISDDLDEAGRLWAALWPEEDVFGSWQIRLCFHESYRRPLHLVIAEEKGHTTGFLALSYVEENDYFGVFPGETWNGRTWLEQNRIPSSSAEVTGLLWEAAPANTTVRYLVEDSAKHLDGSTVDETGYFFNADLFGYQFEEYWNTFSGKSRKRLTREAEGFSGLECGPSSALQTDINWMFRMNLSNFGDNSYFSDPRFMAGFESMLSLLNSSGRLRVTTAMVGGRRAAVDVGAVVENRYTVLAGSTSPEFPGIAKAINLHHIRMSCEQRFARTDFLCGDFGWKERFHLTPRPLYAISVRTPETVAEDGIVIGCV